MLLKVIGSSSKGNCYILESSSEALILEAGCKLLEVRKALQWQLSKVAGCCISHEHKDHAGQALEYTKAGIKVLAPAAVIENMQLERNVQALRLGSAYHIGGFRVQPFKVEHDVPCVGYVVEHKEMGKLVFFTDTYTCRWRFKDVATYLIEANYCDDLLEKNVEAGLQPAYLRDRLMVSHMEIGNTIKFLQTSQLQHTQNIVLVHLSGNNSMPAVFKREVTAATGKPTYIARAGMELEIGNNII